MNTNDKDLKRIEIFGKENEIQRNDVNQKNSQRKRNVGRQIYVWKPRTKGDKITHEIKKHTTRENSK